MSTIEQNLIGNTAGLSRVNKVLRYFFFALLIGTVIYSIGGTFFGRDRLIDYSVAESALLLASLAPGYSRPIPGAHWALRACEWAVMGAALVSTAAVIVGDITYHGVRHAPYNMPRNVAVGAALVAFCFSMILLVSKERARRRGLLPPAR